MPTGGPRARKAAATCFRFTTNDSDGAGYCYSYDGGSVSAVWDTEGAGGLTYTLQGMAASDGYLVFGNDYDNVYIVHAA